MKALFIALFGIVAVVAVVTLVAAVYGIGGIIFSWFWNWLAPVVVATAPHLSWKAGAAAGILLGAAQALLVRISK